MQPKRVKYRNHHRGRRKGMAVAGSTMNFGEFGIKATEAAWVTSRQIEAARRAMTRYARRGGKIWIRVFPDKSVTARAAETRMGSGKGAVDHWVAVVKPGRVMFEIALLGRASELRIVEIYANEGPRIKRFRARARGRVAKIIRRNSHITVVVDAV